MKSILLCIVLATSAFAQRTVVRVPPPHRPVVVVRPAPPVVVRPYFGVGVGWNYDPYWYAPYGPYYSPRPDPCKKEKVKDGDGHKHEILMCLQSDGTYQIIHDEDNYRFERK